MENSFLLSVSILQNTYIATCFNKKHIFKYVLIVSILQKQSIYTLHWLVGPTSTRMLGCSLAGSQRTSRLSRSRATLRK